ncbi:carbohydrate ABC transporter permease [Paenibacillus tritici]|uniref:Carbohydrate ABC transporter permease n=1 Tax=Paenibacillus tritici TaxID=1873425 RepID=A0ABX2DPH7_9BACL|nr:carbohydrate ABC transporter permease [Paenibacillus tritici]NQX45918.1 carbohydrate ABC transporter permease [Paenibacillus tritici]
MTESRGEKLFYRFNYVFLTLLMIIVLFPVLYVLSASFSSPDAVVSGRVILFPVEPTLDAYKAVFREPTIWLGYANTLFYTVAGTLVSMVLTICGAYSLSKRRLKGRKAINLMISFTLVFNAGIIPIYMNFRSLDLLDTRSAIIFGFAISTFNVIILRTFFQSVPEELEEAARIDGASEATILLQIMLPLSKAALATVTLFYAVGRWNGYFWAMVLLRSEDKVPLQVLLNRLVVQMKPSDSMMVTDSSYLIAETVIYATIVVAVLPMMLFYPFIQKYFVHGVMIGSIKG